MVHVPCPRSKYADLVCITYGLRNPDWLQDRLLVILSDVREAREGRFLAVTGETGNLVTLRDEQIVDERKKAAVRLQDLLIDDRAGFGFTPETQALRASLKAYLEYLDTIEFKARKNKKKKKKEKKKKKKKKKNRKKRNIIFRRLNSSCPGTRGTPSDSL
jgi:hypothetical protein